MIEDLGSYSVDRFISFTAESYSRLFERQNIALWPAQLPVIALGIGAVVLALRGKGRAVAVLLALAVTFAAISYHFRLYAELTPVGLFFGWAFLVQALSVLAWGFLSRFDHGPRLDISTWIGLGLAVFGTALYPLLALLADRSWTGAEVFGIAPDPTVCATLGILLILARPRWLLLLLPVPLLWCAVSGATLHVLEAPLAMIPPSIGSIALIGAVLKASRKQELRTPPDMGAG